MAGERVADGSNGGQVPDPNRAMLFPPEAVRVIGDAIDREIRFGERSPKQGA